VPVFFSADDEGDDLPPVDAADDVDWCSVCGQAEGTVLFNPEGFESYWCVMCEDCSEDADELAERIFAEG